MTPGLLEQTPPRKKARDGRPGLLVSAGFGGFGVDYLPLLK